jgi:predicted DNA-binding transcriptional regulator AlpA
MQAKDLNLERLLTRDEVEALFGITRRYLEVSAVRGDGPPMIRVGSRMVRYRVRDLHEWIDWHRVASTSDRG